MDVHSTSSTCPAEEAPAGYKQTEVGVIPEDWDVRPLGNLIVSLEAGVSVNSVDKDNEVSAHDMSILKTSCVIGGKFLPEESKTIVARDIQRAKLNPRKDTIVISRMNTPVLVGECGYVDLDYPSLFLPDRLWMIRHDDRTPHCVRWLAYLLSSRSFNRVIKESATGTSGSMKNISKGSLLSVRIPFPPTKAEQEAIAEALSDADALIESLEQLLVKKRQLKQAAMQQLLTGKTRLPGFSPSGTGGCIHGECVPIGYKQTEVGVIPQDWMVRSLRSCLRSVPDYGINAAAVPFDDGLPTYLRITDISEDNRFRPSPRVSVKHPHMHAFFLRKGDLVFARTGASVGKSYLYTTEDGPLVFAGFLIRATPNPGMLDPAFLSYCVQSKRYWDWVATMSIRSGQPGINGQEYGTFQISLPEPSEQRAIATVLSDMDAEIAALEQRRDKTRVIKQGMMQQLLTGRIRLVSAQEEDGHVS